MGQKPGLLELVPTPVNDLVAYTEYRLNQEQKFCATPFTMFPNLLKGINFAKQIAAMGSHARASMPVIDEPDLEAFKSFLSGKLENVTQALEDRGIFCETCTSAPRDLWVIQRQIYFDKSMDATVKSGPKSTKDFLQSVHLVVSRDNYIIDGNHRWLSAMVLDPSMPLPLLKIGVESTNLLSLALEFSDNQGHSRNL